MNSDERNRMFVDLHNSLSRDLCVDAWFVRGMRGLCRFSVSPPTEHHSSSASILHQSLRIGFPLLLNHISCAHDLTRTWKSVAIYPAFYRS